MVKAFFILLSTAIGAHAIEKPDYESLEKEGKFELRKYANITVIAAPMDGMDRRDESFRKLFAYISGKNGEKKKIAMTAPVFMNSGEDDKVGAKGRMSFVVPKKVVSAGAPDPGGEDLELTEIAEGLFAVLEFKGWTDADKRSEAMKKLAELITNKNLIPVDDPFFAFYNPPWTPEIFRTNEVWQRVER